MGNTKSNSSYTAKLGSLKSPQTNPPKSNTPKANTPKANTPKANTPKANTPKANTPKTNTPKANTPKTNNTTNYYNSPNYSMPQKNGGYYSSPNYSISPKTNTTNNTYNRTNTCNTIASIKKGNSNLCNNYIRTTNYNTSYTNNVGEKETLNVFDKTKVNYDNIDMSKIAVSAQNATDNKFINVNKDIWTNAALNITDRGDGTYLIRNGEVPIGFTTKDGLKNLFTPEKKNDNTSGNPSSPEISNQKNTYNSNINGPYDPTIINFNEIDFKRLASTEDGAFTGQFTNLNLSAYKNSKLNYEVNENGTVAIINKGKTIGYTDIFGISEKKNTKYNDNPSPLMDYLVNTNANHSLTSVEDLTQEYMRKNIRSLEEHANLGGNEQERLERFQELFPSITSASNPYVSRSTASAQMETIKVPIWDGEKRTTMDLTVHNKLVENYKGAFSELADMKYRVDPSTTAAYVYRNTQGTSGSGGRLSDHSFGGAFDLNWDVNPIQKGKNTNKSDRVITDEVAAVMNKYGFAWGGDWNGEKDYMHFSYTGS